MIIYIYSPQLSTQHYFRKIIEIPILDEESYEKNLIMYVNIEEPRHIAGEKII